MSELWVLGRRAWVFIHINNWGVGKSAFCVSQLKVVQNIGLFYACVPTLLMWKRLKSIKEMHNFRTTPIRKQKCLFTPGSVQDCGYDGPGLRHDCRDCALLLRLCDRAAPVSENCCHLSTLFGATVLAASLWLWDEGCQVCAHCCWKPQGISTQILIWLDFLFIYLNLFPLLACLVFIFFKNLILSLWEFWDI